MAVVAMLTCTQSQKFTRLCFDLPRCYSTAARAAIRHQEHGRNIFRKCGLWPLEQLHRAPASTCLPTLRRHSLSVVGG